MKTLVEHCKKLSIGDITKRAKSQLLESLAYADISVSENGLSLTTTPCTYGGKRFWLVCPGCEKRVGTLYQKPIGMRLLCRKCNDLTYLKSRYHKMV